LERTRDISSTKELKKTNLGKAINGFIKREHGRKTEISLPWKALRNELVFF